jgi:hypothetical protein
MPISNKKELVNSRANLDKDGDVSSWWLEIKYTQTGVKKGETPFEEILFHNAIVDTPKKPDAFTTDELIALTHPSYDEVFDSHYQHSLTQA